MFYRNHNGFCFVIEFNHAKEEILKDPVLTSRQSENMAVIDWYGF